MKPTLFATLGLAALAAGCTTSAPRAKGDAPAISVSTARAELTEVPSSLEAGGVVRARATAAIASRVMAWVVEVPVRPGDRVRRGAPLVMLDARELTAQHARAVAGLASAEEAGHAAESDIRAAEATVALARATYDRTRGLQQKRSATAQEFDQALAARDAADARLVGARARAAATSAAREAAQAALEAASVASSYAVLTAPFDGIVTERSVDPGSMANPGVPLLTLEDSSAFRLEVSVDEARVRLIAIGQQADVSIGSVETEVPAPGERARISEISRVDPTAHSFLIKLDLANAQGLRSGLFGRARFGGPSRRTLTIPASAVIRRGQLAFVFTVDRDHRARLQPVSPGATAGDRIEVLAGLIETDRVVLNPPASLSDGALVAGASR